MTGAVDVGASLESCGRLGFEAELGGWWRAPTPGANQALSSAIRLVPSETSDDRPPITPAIATASSLSAITSIFGSSTRDSPSSVLIRLARTRGADANLRAGQQGGIERVHRMPHLEHDVVGDVDDVVDRPDTGGERAARAIQSGDGLTVTSATASA